MLEQLIALAFDLVASPIGLAALALVAFAVRADARRSLEPPSELVVPPRVRRAQNLIQLERSAAFGLAGLTVLLWLAGTGLIGPGDMGPTPPRYEPLSSWLAAAGLTIGLLGVVRFSRIDPEVGERDWRYRNARGLTSTQRRMGRSPRPC